MQYTFTFLFCLLGLFSCGNSSSSATSQIVDSADIKDITLEDAVALMTTAGYTTLDVRKPSEIAEGKIINSAMEIDYFSKNFKGEIEKLDRDGKYIMYCKSGGRSGKTLKLMKELGFKNAYNVLGGITAYRKKYGDQPIAE